MRRAIVGALLAYAVVAPPAWAKGHKDDDDSSATDDDSSDDTPKPKTPAKKTKAKGKAAPAKGKAVPAKGKQPPKKDDDSDDSDSDDDAKPTKGKGKGARGDNENGDAPEKGDKADKGNSDKSDSDKDKGDKDDKGSDDAGSDDAGSDDADSTNSTPTKKPPAEEPVKQDLNGHDLGTKKSGNEFEHDRFFVDKTDTKKTAQGTLVQGSLTASAFAYHESGGTLSGLAVPTASPFNRLWADLRLQTDFRHIGGGRWDARVDVRGRAVTDPGNETPLLSAADTAAAPDRIQSGALGENKLDLRELWLTRNGEKSDVTIGRQFITDMAGIKVDGVRVDYASSNKFTYLGFVGLYPVRGSRSVFTDYPKEYTDPDATGAVKDAGRFTGTAGFGTAYRTSSAYGSLGLVALVPQDASDPRAFVTAQGYWRASSTLDVYHYAILDGLSGAGLTELSGGINYKPTPGLRLTASFNHVDTDELNVQASNYLLNPDVAFTQIQNTTYIERISTNEARGGVSAGFGDLQRFQITVTGAYRYRPDLTLTPPGDKVATDAVQLTKAQSAEIYAGITDRRSVANLRLGLDGSQTFGVGDSTYYRTTSTSVRAFAGHDIKNGRGEWEAEVDYLKTKDDNVGTPCTPADADLASCFGDANATILAAGGTLYYRLTRDVFVIGSAYVSRETLTHQAEPMLATGTSDPATIGVTGYGRIAYRF
jgi:hypothetical protein